MTASHHLSARTQGFGVGLHQLDDYGGGGPGTLYDRYVTQRLTHQNDHLFEED
jgi:hypothetical protein